MDSDREALERAAARFGIELEYIDTWGRRHRASDVALRGALDALGIPAESSEAIHNALERDGEAQWSRAFPPAIVVREDAESIRLQVPAERVGATVKLEIRWETGEAEQHCFWLRELREIEHERGRIAKLLPLPRPFRPGYHQIRIYWMPENQAFGESRLIVCPRRARTPSRRMAGVAVSLYGLRSARNWGVGDVTDLKALIDALASAGVAFIALNPLHAIPNRQPYNTSPYLPECSLYRNFLYLDVERVPGHSAGDVSGAEIEALRATELVEYERTAALKLTALRAAFARFGGSEGFEEYARLEGQPLEDYATYCSLWESRHGANPEVWMWTEWPEELRCPRSPAVREWACAHREDIRFFQFLQWQLDRQFAEAQAHALAAGMPIGIYHDLALATDRFGADLWANRGFYSMGARVGAPPDELAPGGQDWGFPPPNREAHRADGYRLFAQSIRNNAKHGGALRIDHVMRFFRLFWIPDDLGAPEGLYVRDWVDDLLGILALESVRGNFIVIGEDLGTVPPGVREKLEETGILGYRLLWFERNRDGSFRLPHEYPQHSAVATTTHDLPTLGGFFRGRDIEARKKAGLVEERDYQAQWNSRRNEIARIEDAMARAGAPHDALSFVLATPSVLAIINQEDLTGETEQQNLPASTWQHPNWRRKMRVAVEDLAPMARELREKIARSGRAPDRI